jgi:3-oxoacyl-(acyl-carrier-protein) synthase
MMTSFFMVFPRLLIGRKRGRGEMVHGAEACIDKVSLGGFAAARALSTSFNDKPELASRPFDTERDGL